MSSTAARILPLLALAAAATTLDSCTESAFTELGPVWYASSPAPQVGGWMDWSADGRTLFWVDRDEARATNALHSMTGANGPILRSLSDVEDFPSPQIVNGDRTIFFTRWVGDSATLLQAPLAGGVAGEPVEVTRQVFRYLASPDGQRVVIASTSSPGRMIALDVRAGTSVTLRDFFEPTVFSPDGSRLLMRNEGANDPSENYALFDPATGASENIAYPDRDSIQAVLRWDGNRPRLVLGGGGATTDLVTGATGSIGLRSSVSLSGDPSAPDRAYTWEWECLAPHEHYETHDTLCGSQQARLVRADINTHVTDVVAYAAETAPTIALSRDGLRLASRTAPRGAIHVKELSRLP